MKKKKPGRPPSKNKIMNLQDINNNKENNFNEINAWPLSIIRLRKIPLDKLIEKDDLEYNISLTLEHSKILYSLLNIIKGSYDFIIMVFLVKLCYITYYIENKNNNDTIHFETILYPDQINYKFKKKCIIKINIKLLMSILKVIPKGQQFQFTLSDINNKPRINKLTISYSNFRDTVFNSEVFLYNNFVLEKPDNRSFIKKQHSLIIILDSKLFCEDILSSLEFHNFITIKYNFLKRVLKFKTNTKLLYKVYYKEGKKCKFLITPNKNIEISIFINPLQKYLKLHKSSNIIKLYISNPKDIPFMICEYDILPSLGTAHIYVQTQSLEEDSENVNNKITNILI
jgi:hypothetical protein